MKRLPFTISIDLAGLQQSPLFYFTLYMGLVGGNWALYHALLPVRIAHHLILTGVLVWWLLKRGLPDTPLLMPLAALVAVIGVSGFNAIDRRMALEYSWHWFTNWLLLLFLIDALRRELSEVFFKAVFIGAGLVAASAILEWLLTAGRPYGLFGVINLTGAYLAALVVPVLAWLLNDGLGNRHRRLLQFLLGLLAAAIMLNQSRGPLLSVVVALVAFGYLTLRSLSAKLALSAVLVGVLSGAVLWMSGQPTHSEGDVIRMDLWAAGEDMLMEYPTGVGAGLFAQAYHQRAMNEDRYTGAHNIYITLAAELGAPGLAAGAAFFLTALYLLIGQERTLKQNGVLAALIGVLVQQVFDNYPSQSWTFLISLYSAYLLYEPRWVNRLIPGVINRLLVYGLAIYGLVFIQWDVAQIHYENALRAYSTEQMQLAIAWDSHNRLYRLAAARLADPSIEINPNYALTNFARLSDSS